MEVGQIRISYLLELHHVQQRTTALHGIDELVAKLTRSPDGTRELTMDEIRQKLVARKGGIEKEKQTLQAMEQSMPEMSEQVQQPQPHLTIQPHLQPQDQAEREPELTPRPHPMPVTVHVPEPVRETSILIDVDEGSPVNGSIEEEDESELAYLDGSPSPSSKPLASTDGNVSARSSLNLELQVALARERPGASSADALWTMHGPDSDSSMS